MSDEFDPMGIAGRPAEGTRGPRAGAALGSEDEKAGRAAANRLLGFIERIERLEDEKAAIADDIKCVIGEAKADGYDTKAIRAVLKIRKKSKAEWDEAMAILETYLAALGME